VDASRCVKQDQIINAVSIGLLLFEHEFSLVDLYEYPLLQNTTKQLWATKMVIQLEAAICYLCSADRMKVERMSRNVSVFDDCNLSNVKCISKIRIYPI